MAGKNFLDPEPVRIRKRQGEVQRTTLKKATQSGVDRKEALTRAVMKGQTLLRKQKERIERIKDK